MKVYITARFQEQDNQKEVEKLCRAVHEAGMKDFCFTRDITEKYDSPKALWQRAYDELQACEALLIDVTDRPTGGRVIEAGMAFALRKRIFIVVHRGAEYKGMFDGIASAVLEYEDYKDLSKQLKKYDEESNFNFTDKTLLFSLLVFAGLALAWWVGQFAVPLAAVTTIGYWLLVRVVLPSMRAFDRLIILLALAAIWLVGISLLLHIQLVLWAWCLLFWIAVGLVLKKMKFTL